MKRNRAPAAALGIFCLCAGVQRLAAADARTPTQAYLAYNAALGTATKLADILPFLSKEYRAMLESRPKADQPTWLERLKDSRMKDVKVTGETVSGNTCTLQATGTSARGNAMKGKIQLVKEDGAWKLDEEGWST